MSITAKDIQEQEFEHSRKGYDVEEVDVFLERVAVEVDAMTRQNQELRARIDELNEKVQEANEKQAEVDSGMSEEERENYESQISDLRSKVSELEHKDIESRRKIDRLESDLEKKGEDESAISAAIISAQKSADNIREEARVEGEKIYREAESKAREIVHDALTEKQKVLTELEQLKRSRNEFQTAYKDMLVRFGNIAEEEFIDEEIKQDDDQDAAEKAAIAEVRSSAASRSADADSKQESMTMPGTRTVAPKPAMSATTSMPAPSGNIADINAFGDTEDIDIDEID